MPSDSKKDPTSGDDAKRDQVLKKLLTTPPKPKKAQKEKDGKK